MDLWKAYSWSLGYEQATGFRRKGYMKEQQGEAADSYRAGIKSAPTFVFETVPFRMRTNWDHRPINHQN